MTRYLAPLAALVVLLGVGCATSGGVKEQLNPIAERTTKNEQTLGDLQKKVDSLSSEVQGLKQQMQTNATANADAVKKAGEDAQAAAARADEAAKRAEEAAANAQKGAKTSKKAFELRQKK